MHMASAKYADERGEQPQTMVNQGKWKDLQVLSRMPKIFIIPRFPVGLFVPQPTPGQSGRPNSTQSFQDSKRKDLQVLSRIPKIPIILRFPVGLFVPANPGTTHDPQLAKAVALTLFRVSKIPV